MIITVEANIGAGKSTLLGMMDRLKLNKPHMVLYENVADWISITDGSNNSIFDLFYQDKKRYSYVFQSYVLMSRISHILETVKNNPEKIIICERSIMTDFEIFAKTLYDSNCISEMEFNVYMKWHALARDIFNIPIAGQIYLRTSPEVCMERIRKRARQSEHLIDVEYLRQLHKKHEQWLMSTETNTIETLVVDGNQNLLDNTEIVSKELKAIEQFINGFMNVSSE